MGHHEDALATLAAEIEYQPPGIEEALAGAAPELASAAELIRREGGAVATFGIGDSDLVGRLAAACEPPGAGRLRPAASTAVADAPREGRVALCHSIGGNTEATLAACEAWRQGGGVVVGITGERGSALVRRADVPVVLEIPRFPPDAKVPGTLTVTVPLAAVWALLDAADGGAADDSARRVAEGVRLALDAAAVEDGAARVLPLTVHVVAERELEAVAAYAEAKLAEGVGVTAVRADPESWLHVQKHAVYPGVLVLALPLAGDPSPLFQAVARETALRGGAFLSSSPLPPAAEGAPLAVALAPRRPLSRQALLGPLCFVQRLVLRLLQGAPERVPYQLGRVTREQVRGLNPRTYAPRAAPAG